MIGGSADARAASGKQLLLLLGKRCTGVFLAAVSVLPLAAARVGELPAALDDDVTAGFASALSVAGVESSRSQTDFALSSFVAFSATFFSPSAALPPSAGVPLLQQFP